MSDGKPATVPGAKGVAKALPPPGPAAALPVPVPQTQARSRDKLLDACHATLASVAASQKAVASEAVAMALELDTVARTTLSATGDGVTLLLRAKSVGDAAESQLLLMRRNLDAMTSGSARLAEHGLRLFIGGSKAFFAPFSAN